MVPERRPSDLTANLEDLASAVERLDVVAPPGPDHWAERHDRVVRTIRSYLIPRIRDPRRPLLVVFAGATGAGKSTLLNSVAGTELSRTGVLRPTTKSPVVFAAEGRSPAYHLIGGVECKVVTGKARILAELTLVDTPDIDSTAVEHRAKAEALIDNADVVIFVSSAMRYADLVPWEVLRRAESRGTSIIPVLNRIRSSSDGACNDYRSLLNAEGLGAEVVAVHEYHLVSDRQMVPAAAIRRLRSRLVDLIEQHRNEASGMVETVLTATVDQATDVVNEAESRLEEIGNWNKRLGLLFSPDVDRLEITIEPRHLGHLDPGAMAALDGSRRFRVRRYLAKSGPSHSQVAAACRRITQLVAGSIEADLRRLVAAFGASRPLDSLIPAETHNEIMRSVRRWKASAEGTLQSLKHPYRNSALLLQLASTVDDRPELVEAFEAIAPELNSYALRAGARWRLEADLAPIYESLRMRHAVRTPVASRDDIEDARAAIAPLIARESRAYA